MDKWHRNASIEHTFHPFFAMSKMSDFVTYKPERKICKAWIKKCSNWTDYTMWLDCRHGSFQIKPNNNLVVLHLNVPLTRLQVLSHWWPLKNNVKTAIYPLKSLTDSLQRILFIPIRRKCSCLAPGAIPLKTLVNSSGLKGMYLYLSNGWSQLKVLHLEKHKNPYEFQIRQISQTLYMYNCALPI